MSQLCARTAWTRPHAVAPCPIAFRPRATNRRATTQAARGQAHVASPAPSSTRAASVAQPPAPAPYCEACAARGQVGPDDTVDWAHERSDMHDCAGLLFRAACTTCPGCHTNLYAECKRNLEEASSVPDGVFPLYGCTQCVCTVNDPSCRGVPWVQLATYDGVQDVLDKARHQVCSLCGKSLRHDCVVDLDNADLLLVPLLYGLSGRPSTTTADDALPCAHTLQTPRARRACAAHAPPSSPGSAASAASDADSDEWVDSYSHAMAAHARMTNPYLVVGSARAPRPALGR